MKHWFGFAMQRKGFTLIELIVAMALSAVILTVLVGFVSYVMRTQRIQTAFVAAQDSIRIAELRIDKDIRASSQTLTIHETDGCHVIRDAALASEVTYCLLEGNLLNRNGILVADHIEQIQLVGINEHTISMLLVGTYEGRSLRYEKIYHLRSASE